MRQLLKKKSDSNWTKGEEEYLIAIKKMITEKPFLAYFARDRGKIVRTDAGRTGLGLILWQRQNDDTIRPIAFASRFLDDNENNFSIVELELLLVVWGKRKFRFYLYGAVVHLNTDHQALEPLKN